MLHVNSAKQLAAWADEKRRKDEAERIKKVEEQEEKLRAQKAKFNANQRALDKELVVVEKETEAKVQAAVQVSYWLYRCYNGFLCCLVWMLATESLWSVAVGLFVGGCFDTIDLFTIQ